MFFIHLIVSTKTEYKKINPYLYKYGKNTFFYQNNKECNRNNAHHVKNSRPIVKHETFHH